MNAFEFEKALFAQHGDRGASFVRKVEPLICASSRPNSEDAKAARYILTIGANRGFLDAEELRSLNEWAPAVFQVIRPAIKSVGSSRRASATDICGCVERYVRAQPEVALPDTSFSWPDRARFGFRMFCLGIWATAGVILTPLAVGLLAALFFGALSPFIHLLERLLP